MTTQQFWKGLGMALISVIVAYLSATPIDLPLMVVTAVCTILAYFGKNLIPWLHSDSPPSSLSYINVISGVLLALATAFTESIGTYLLSGQVLWPVVLKITVYTTGTYLLSTFFAPPYTTEKKAFFANKSYKAMYRSKIAMIAILLSLSFGVSAQGPFTGFFKPASANPDVYQMVQVSKAMKSGTLTADFDQPIINETWLIRPTVGVVAKAFTYNNETKELESSTLNKVGFGMGYQKYEEINGQAYNSFGANILLLFDSDFDMSKLNFTAAATIHALKLVDVGIARDFGMKQWLLLTGITYSF